MIPARCNTLDKAGYTYNPFTTLDWWGRPNGFNVGGLEQTQNLMLGADDSAIPELGHPALRTNRNPVGSDMSSENWEGRQADDLRRRKRDMSNATLLAFIGILVLALWLKPPAPL
jgi:hypothetical protein